MSTPKFRLFRLTKPMNNGCTHAGEAWLGGRMYAITAKVVETPHGKQFHGDVQAPGEAISKILRPSASDGDLVSQASVGNSEASGRTHASEEFPFDDPVPF